MAESILRSIEYLQHVSLLGEGGMGLVYHAYHSRFKVEIAIKTTREDGFSDEYSKMNFLEECLVWSKLDPHPNVVLCYFAKNIANIPFLFVEFVSEGSIDDWIQGGRLYDGTTEAIERRIVTFAIDAAKGLDFAHKSGVVHQDVKPSNLLVGHGERVKLTDFGLARARTHQSNPNGTKSSTLLATMGGMTPAYCSPEQFNGDKLSRSTDVWSWALLMLTMFAGEIRQETGIHGMRDLEFFLSIGPDPNMPKIPTQIVELLYSCFVDDPSARPEFKTIIDVLSKYYESKFSAPLPQSDSPSSDRIATILNNRAVTHYELGERDKAVDVWKHALEIAPVLPYAKYNLNLHEWRAGRMSMDQFLSDLQNLSAFESGDGCIALNMMACVHAESGDLEASKRLLSGVTWSDEFEGMVSQIRPDSPKGREEPTLFCESKKYNFGFVCPHVGGTICVSYGGECFVMRERYGSTAKLQVEPGVIDVSVSPDGKFAAFCTKDTRSSIWNCETGKRVAVVPSAQYQDVSASLSAQGEHLVTTDTWGGVHLFDCCLNTRAQIARFTGDMESTQKRLSSRVCVAVHPFQRIVAVFSRGTCSFIDFSGSKVATVFKDPMRLEKAETWWSGIAFSHSGNRLAIGRQSVDYSSIRVLDVATGNIISECRHSGCRQVALSTDGEYLVTCGWKVAMLWHVNSGRRVFRVASSDIDERTLAAGICDMDFLWANQFGKILKVSLPLARAPFWVSPVSIPDSLREHSRRFEKLIRLAKRKVKANNFSEASTYLRSARKLATSVTSPVARNLWRLCSRWAARKEFRNAWVAEDFHAPEGGSFKVQTNADGSMIFVLTSSGELLTRAVGSLTEKRKHLRQKPHGVGLSFSRCDLVLTTDEGVYIETIDDENVRAIKLNDLRSLKQVWSYQYWLGWHSDRSVSLIDIYNQTVVWRTDPMRRDPQLLCGGVTTTQMVLRNDNDGTLFCEDIFDRGSNVRFSGHAQKVTAAVTTPDGLTLCSADQKGEIRVWRYADGKCLRVFREHTAEVTALETSLDGTHLFSGSIDRTVRVWNLASELCVATLNHDLPVSDISIADDASFLAVSHGEGRSRLWNLSWEITFETDTELERKATEIVNRFKRNSHRLKAFGLSRGWFRRRSARILVEDSELPLEITKELKHRLQIGGFGQLDKHLNDLTRQE